MAHTKEHKEGDRIVGTYKSQADKKRALREKGLDNDGNPTAEAFDGTVGTRDYTLDSKKNISKRRQKALDKQARKDARREKRAEKIADRKLMSVDQAQDFMRNRKDRFNTAFGNVLLDLTGNEDKKGVIKDRYYRKEGSGTIQNVAKLDKQGNPTGETFDATDPFQFSRTRVTYEPDIKAPTYDSTIAPMPMDDLTVDINIPKQEYPDDPRKKQKKIVEDKKEKEISKIVTPKPGPPVIDTIGLPNNSFMTHTDSKGNLIDSRKSKELLASVTRDKKLPGIADDIIKTKEEISKNFKNKKFKSIFKNK